MANPPKQTAGVVYLVGAGPGDPGLLTLRGAECLALADVVLYDFLANRSILEHVRPETELRCCGKHGRAQPNDRAPLPQDEINRELIELARAGKQVVRLKGGDPAIFARGAEELAALRAADIRYEVVPGITAAQAAASYAGIPITHRNDASAVAFITGQETTDKQQSSLDFDALARFPGTLVFYMGVTTARQWSDALITAGLASDTPAAIIRRISWPDQQLIRCPLAEVANELEKQRIRPPVVVVVGEVVRQAPATDWFAERPLFGMTVLITRPAHQAGSMTKALEHLGARCWRHPVIEIQEPSSWDAVDDALGRLGMFQWLVFSSANGVRFLLDRLLREHGDLRRLGHLKLAVIGERTAEALAEYHLDADLTPEEFRAEALAETLLPHAAGNRFLLARASRGREILGESLAEAGAAVEQIVVYDSLDVTEADEATHHAIAAGEIDWVTVTSSAIARSLVALFGDDLRRTKLLSISPITTATLAELGYEVAAEASEYTSDGMIAELLAAESKV